MLMIHLRRGDVGLWTLDHRLWTLDFRVWTLNFGLWAPLARHAVFGHSSLSSAWIPILRGFFGLGGFIS